jgi:hypothetical protein
MLALVSNIQFALPVHTSTACFGVLEYPANNAGLQSTQFRSADFCPRSLENDCTHLARRPLAAITPLTPVVRLMSSTSAYSQISPFPTHGTSPLAHSTANLIPGRETGAVEG